MKDAAKPPLLRRRRITPFRGRGPIYNWLRAHHTLATLHHTPAASLMLETAKRSEGFFEQLQRHPVPLEDAAIRAISNNSMALDIYCWLSYRLHALPSAKLVTWPALKAQFGVGYGKLAGFKYRFQPSLALAMAVYREAKVTVEDRGLMLHPSKAAGGAKDD